MLPLAGSVDLARKLIRAVDGNRLNRELDALQQPKALVDAAPLRARRPSPEAYQAWLADVLARIADHANRDLHQLLPWNWRPQDHRIAA